MNTKGCKAELVARLNENDAVDKPIEDAPTEENTENSNDLDDGDDDSQGVGNENNSASGNFADVSSTTAQTPAVGTKEEDERTTKESQEKVIEDLRQCGKDWDIDGCLGCKASKKEQEQKHAQIEIALRQHENLPPLVQAEMPTKESQTKLCNDLQQQQTKWGKKGEQGSQASSETVRKQGRQKVKKLFDQAKTDLNNFKKYIIKWILLRTHEMEIEEKLKKAVEFDQNQEKRKVTAASSLSQKVKYGVLGDISNKSETEIVESISTKAELSDKKDEKMDFTKNINLNSVKIRRKYNNGILMLAVLKIHDESTVDQFMKRHKTELSRATLSGMFTFAKTIMKHNATWLLKSIQSTASSYLVRRAEDGTLGSALAQFDYDATVAMYKAAADEDEE